MRVQVETREIKKEKSVVELGKFRIKSAPMLSEHSVRLFQKFFIVEHARGERLGVFSNPLGVKFADLFRQVARIIGWRRDGQSRILRINIDRRHIKLKTRMRLLEIKAADPLHIADERHKLKLHRNPSTPFAF